MRVERTGSVDKLTPRVEQFLRGGIAGVSLDEVHSPEETRIDYSCLRGLVAVELKTLEGDPSERTNNFIDTLRDREDFPTFFGAVPMAAAFKNMAEPEKLWRAAIERIGRAIVTHMKKGNGQLARHAQDYPRRSCLKLLLLVNEDHPEYDPETVAWIVRRELARHAGDEPRYASIDAVLYLTERHGQPIEGRMAFPIVVIQGPAMDSHPWKEDVLIHVMRAWAKWQDRPLHKIEDEAPISFETIEHVPDQMPRHELWRLQYRRQPYLRSVTDEQLRDEFDEVMLVTSLWGLHGSPIKLDMDAAQTALERFTHIQIEMHERAIPMERFDHSLSRQLAAAERLKLPPAVASWLRELETTHHT